MDDSLPLSNPPKTRRSPEEGEIMIISEVAELLRLSETTVRRMCERKELPAVKFGSQWRIRRKDVLALFDQSA
jgi:excisionase family DNA binding protein